MRKIAPRGKGVPVGALFGRDAAAVAVTPVIKDEYIQPQLMEQAQGIQAVGDISGVTVQE